MKTIKNYIILIALALTFTSCLVDDDVATDAFDQGKNIVGFGRTAMVTNALADGNSTSLSIPLLITGPTRENLSEDVNVTFEVDTNSSTAIDGVHFNLDSSPLTLMANNNYEANLPLEIITNGIVPPLAEAPVLVLNIKSVSNNGIVISGRTGQITVKINYLCFSDLAGDYTTTSNPVANVTISTISDGVYLHSALPDLSAGGNPIEFEFSDTCGVISIDTLVFDSYLLQGSGTVDSQSGVITINGYILYNETTVDSGAFFDNSGETYIYTPN